MPRTKSVTRKQLVKEMSEETGDTQKKIESIIDLFFTKVTEALSESESVRIHNFGSFHPKIRDSYQGRNPSTGKTMMIASKKVVRFTASEALKSAL